MTRKLLLAMALALPACGPRSGPLNADFSHTHEVEYKPIKSASSPAAASTEPITSVKRLDKDALPEGLRMRRSNQALVADPLRRGKFKRIRLTDVETATGYPTIDDPHRVVGEFVVKLRVRYDAFSADQEEVLAEEAALAELGAELAADAAKQNGGNAIVRVHSSMKPNGEWWKYPYKNDFCRNERKRCVKQSMRFQVLHLSDKPRVVPTADELLELSKSEGYRQVLKRKDPKAKFVARVKRHHCYRLSFALTKDALVPEGGAVIEALALFRVYQRFGVDPVYARGRSMGDMGCAGASASHDFKLTAYRGQSATSGNKVDISEIKGLVWSLEERPMKPAEATQYFCGECVKAARSCRHRPSCKRLNSCLRKRGITVNRCADVFNY